MNSAQSQKTSFKRTGFMLEVLEVMSSNHRDVMSGNLTTFPRVLDQLILTIR